MLKLVRQPNRHIVDCHRTGDARLAFAATRHLLGQRRRVIRDLPRCPACERAVLAAERALFQVREALREDRARLAESRAAHWKDAVARFTGSSC